MRRKSFRRALTLCLSLILFGLLLLGLTVYLKSTGWNRKNRETCPHETWINGECAFCGFPCRLSAAVQQDAGNKQCRDDDQSNDKALPFRGMSGRF